MKIKVGDTFLEKENVQWSVDMSVVLLVLPLSYRLLL